MVSSLKFAVVNNDMNYAHRLGPLKHQVKSNVSDVVMDDRIKVVVECPCGRTNEVGARSLIRRWADKGQYLCKSCSVKTYVKDPDRIGKAVRSFGRSMTNERRKKMSDAVRRAWSDDEYRERISEATTHDNKTNPLKKLAREKALEAFAPNHLNHLNKIRKKSGIAIKRKWNEDQEYRTSTINKMKDALSTVVAKEKHSESTSRAVRKMWQNEEYRRKMSEVRSKPEFIAISSNKSKELWKNQDYRNKQLAAWTPERRAGQSMKSRELLSKPEVKERLISSAFELWQKEDYRLSISNAIKELWNDDDFRNNMMKIAADPNHRELISQKTREALARPEIREKLAIVRSKQGETSKCEVVVCDLLRDLGIKFEQFKRVGFYTFDIAVPTNDKTILIEVQGDYWHSLPEVTMRDKQKATYVRQYHSDKYVIKYIWEHELSCKDKVIDTLKYWLGITKLETKDFSFDDVVLEIINNNETSRFLSRHHYLSGIGRNGYAVGAKLNGELIAVASFTPVIRNETAIKQGVKHNEIRELTRFCIHPSYQKKNFATWFLSRATNMFSADNVKITKLVAFADHGFNHHGTIYKAANWMFDGLVDPTYWYVDDDGYVMHKKTLYGKAINLKMKEAEFAKKFGYHKVKGHKKSRFIFSLRR